MMMIPFEIVFFLFFVFYTKMNTSVKKREKKSEHDSRTFFFASSVIQCDSRWAHASGLLHCFHFSFNGRTPLGRTWTRPGNGKGVFQKKANKISKKKEKEMRGKNGRACVCLPSVCPLTSVCVCIIIITTIMTVDVSISLFLPFLPENLISLFCVSFFSRPTVWIDAPLTPWIHRPTLLRCVCLTNQNQRHGR